MLNVTYAECRYAECLGADVDTIQLGKNMPSTIYKGCFDSSQRKQSKLNFKQGKCTFLQSSLDPH